MPKRGVKDAQSAQLLVDAHRIFFDASDYEPNILIGYCRLIKDILGEEADSIVCDIVLAGLIKSCKKLKDNTQFALITRYGLNGKKPMTYAEIGEILYMTKSDVYSLCDRALQRLRLKSYAMQYNIPIRKQHLCTQGALPANNHLSVLKLSTRAHNALYKHGITTVQTFMKLSPEYMNLIRGLGKKCIAEILQKQQELSKTNSK